MDKGPYHYHCFCHFTCLRFLVLRKRNSGSIVFVYRQNKRKHIRDRATMDFVDCFAGYNDLQHYIQNQKQDTVRRANIFRFPVVMQPFCSLLDTIPVGNNDWPRNKKPNWRLWMGFCGIVFSFRLMLYCPTFLFVFQSQTRNRIIQPSFEIKTKG